MGKFTRFHANLDNGELLFRGGRDTIVSTPVQVIGTYNVARGSWMWAWDHPSVPARLAAHARKVREQQKWPLLQERAFECDEVLAWQLTAMAFQLNRANGAYRAPFGPVHVFMTFGALSFASADHGRQN